jgi:hypothetical protein
MTRPLPFTESRVRRAIAAGQRQAFEEGRGNSRIRAG